MTTDESQDIDKILNDDTFQALMLKRSRIRWSLVSVLVAAYMSYGLAGLYVPDVMALPVFGTSIPLVMFLGFLIIVLSIVLAYVHEHIIVRLKYDLTQKSNSQQ